MSVFPDITPSYDYSVQPAFYNLRLGPTDGDFIQRRRKRLTPLMRFTLQFNNLIEANIKTLYDFFIARYGGWDAFAFFDFDSKTWTAISVGTGDGSTTSFALIAKETSARTVYVDSVAQIEGTDYTFYSGQGTDGQDKITFASAPANGAVITADYTGRKYYSNCIFGEDYMDRNLFEVKLYKTGLTIVEVSS